MALNSSLHIAKKVRYDEFYTQLPDIERELRHYSDQLKGKVVFCNCDDPFESNFFKYFAMNFNQLGLKKLISTCYKPSPVSFTQLNLWGESEIIAKKGREKSNAYYAEITEVVDYDGDGSINLADVERMLRELSENDGNGKNKLRKLKGNGEYSAGDFRSDECVELLKQADVVVTNPPFSLFREYVAQLFEHSKKFVIIGSKNAITYKEIFMLIKENRLWLGYGFKAGNAYFSVPNPREFASGVYDEKTGLVKFRNLGWYTNLTVDRSEDPLTPYIKYEDGLKQGLYPKYDNYDAIEVGKVAEIPVDYYGAMGVPITFLDKWVPPAPPEREREREREIGSRSSALTDTSTAIGRRTDECSSTARRCMRESSSSEYEIIGNLGSYAPDGYSLSGAIFINGKKIFKRILVRRVQDNLDDRQRGRRDA